jgi:hypothetical protein
MALDNSDTTKCITQRHLGVIKEDEVSAEVLTGLLRNLDHGDKWTFATRPSLYQGEIVAPFELERGCTERSSVLHTPIIGRCRRHH